jgi:chloride channel 3/4/5
MELEDLKACTFETSLNNRNRKGGYRNLHTIDWLNDCRKDHNRHINFIKTPHSFQINLLYSAQSWILTLLTGIAIGLIGGWIDLTSAWLTDTKLGYCRNQWYISKKVCCKHMADKYGYCNDWIDWSYALLWIRNLSVINWIIYVVLSTLFGLGATVIVTNISLYASGSGSVFVLFKLLEQQRSRQY